ncbi:MAG: BrnT family toxin [Burkholderiaceae bacterium]
MHRFIEWDSDKAQSNYLKHGIRFEFAARVFDDPLAVAVQDRYENGELRWQTLGRVEGLLLLLVAHTVRDGEDGVEVIRIISARRPTKQEKRRYENN